MPVINALDDKDHPCQVLGDLLTLREKYGEQYKRKKLVMTWGYAKRQKSPGVLHSMLVAASLLGMDVRFAHPEGFELDEEYLAFARDAARQSGATLEFCNDLHEAAEGADAIYVKSYISLTMTKEEDARVREEIKDAWCLSEAHYTRANPGAIFMDCMPLIRGEQVTPENRRRSPLICDDQAKNRLPRAKGDPRVTDVSRPSERR